MISRAVYRRQPGRRWLAALATAGLVATTLAYVVPAIGFSQSNWELDKNATNTLASSHLGGLKSSANAGATALTVCELLATPSTPFTIQVDAEQMTVESVGTASTKTGGCSFANANDTALDVRVYTLASPTTASHVSQTPRNDVTLVEAQTGHDWNQVYEDYVNGPDKGLAAKACTGSDLEAIACLWLNRPNTGTASSANGFYGPTTFTQTTADPNPITSWRWTNQSVPDADEINDAYAAKYSNSKQELFFGMDRYAVNGSKDIGFWFFHQTVSPLDDGTFSGAHCAPGQTTDGCPGAPRGDILLLTTFTQGGAASAVRVYEWVGSGGSDGTLNLLDTFGDCVPGNTTDKGCATVANTTVESPWTHQEKPTGASADTFYAGGFMEGGVDLTDLGLEGCFASFLGTSRASPSITAQPKAFVLGRFESCTGSVTTTPQAGTATLSTPAPLPSTGISIGSGTVQVKDSALLDVKGATSFTGTMKFYICGPIDAPDLCDTGGVPAGTFDANANGTYLSDAVTLTEVGRYCWRADWSSTTPGLTDGASDSSPTECFDVTPVTPSLSTQAVGPPLSQPVSAPVPFGQPVYDAAFLSGTATQKGTNGGFNGTYKSINATDLAPAGDTITFELRNNSCAKDTVTSGTNPQDVDVSGDGTYYSAGVVPSLPGIYHWVATYTSSDANTNGTTHNLDCTDGDETVTVQKLQPTMGTAQYFVPNDSATITVDSGGGDLAGSVTFKMWTNETCSGDAAYTSASPIDITTGTGTGTSRTVMSGNTEAYSTSGTVFYWVVTYTSTNPAHFGVTSACGNEHSSIFITNGLSQPAPAP